MGQQGAYPVADEVDRGLMPRDDQHGDRGEQLVGAERVTLLPG
jgi:hypothetical protein